jgi:flagellar biosynthesis component FlhA
MNEGHDKAVLLADYRLRPHLAALLSRQLPQLPILSYDEVAVGTQVEPIATVSLAAANGDRQAARLPTGPAPALAVT